MYYLIAFLTFFYIGYKVRGAVEIVKLLKLKKEVKNNIEEYFNN